MKKSIISAIVCFTLQLNVNLKAQLQDSVRHTNLFEYGEALTSEKVNFDNLFKNFPLLISNADPIKLLSYEYAGIAKSRKQIVKFVSSNIYPNAPVWDTSIAFGESENGSIISKKPLIMLDIFKLNIDKSSMKDIVRGISEGYATGSKVYKIKFVYFWKTYDYYVFVNPETKQVFTDGNIFGFKFPIID
ncbi:MAG: hypothetical protein LBL33_05950 [Tannerella sp.]|jgi:hypothetical protein|nr:hypothetical protein [Tannerella sp.]